MRNIILQTDDTKVVPNIFEIHNELNSSNYVSQRS